MRSLRVRSCTKKVAAVISQALLITTLFIAKAFAADNIDITSGLQVVDSKQLASKIMAIALGVASLSGVGAVIMLIYNSSKLGGKEKTREEGIDGIKWALIGLVVIGLSSIIVGFIAYLVQTAQSA